MSMLGKKVTKAVAKKVGDAAAFGVVNHMEKTQSVDAIVNNSTSKYMLFIKRKSFSISRGFTVTNENGEKKYEIKTDPITFGYPCIRLLDTEENEIGKVKLASKAGMRTYTIYFGDRAVGVLRQKISLKVNFDLSFNGWHLEGNLMQNAFSLKDQTGKEIMKFNDVLSSRDTYILEYDGRENEILGLLMVMSVEIALHGDD